MKKSLRSYTIQLLQQHLEAENVDEYEVAYCRYVIADISCKRAAYRYRHLARKYDLAVDGYNLALDNYSLALNRGESGEQQHDLVLEQYDVVLHLSDRAANEHARFARRGVRSTAAAQDFSRAAETRLADITAGLTVGT